jgi:hypothetical protein
MCTTALPPGRLILGLLIWAAAMSACSNTGLNNFTPAPTTPAVAIPETFEGIVTVNGAATHSFIAQRAGAVTARLLALEPDTAVTLGLSLGTWNGAVCQIVLANDAAKLDTTVVGTAQAAANLCVRIYDVGQLTAPSGYQIVVTHSG